MRLLKTCLLGQASSGQCAAFNPAHQFKADEFVKVLEVHLDQFLSMLNIFTQDED
jgi:hypothetical protein